MKRRKIFRVISAAMSAVLLMASVPGSAPAQAAAQKDAGENLLKLWYDEPVSQGPTSDSSENGRWEQLTLPVGDSYMGANVYGEIANERLSFNHKTLWNGGPSTSRPDYNGGNLLTASNGKSMVQAYKDVVNAFQAGDDSTASTLCNQLVGAGSSQGYGAYQSWGDIYLTFSGLTDTMQTSSYERNLDLTTAVANVDFTAGGTDYHREYFISYPDNVLAMRLTAEGSNKLNFNVKFPVANDENNVVANRLGKTASYAVNAAEGTIVMNGEMQDNQMKMNSMLKVITSGGITANSDGESLDISNADEAVIFVSADTDYKNVYPKYRTGETQEELAASVAETIAAAVQKGFEGVKKEHLADYKGLFDRVAVDLGQAASGKTTDELMAAYKNNSASEAEKRLIEVLLYQYGRYLTIASSRAGDLPSNLQGVWQNRVGNADQVAWGSDYHLNVNLQMNYWPAYSGNLAECALPLIDYVDSLREPGRVTAAAYFGIESGEGEENGFTAHTQNNPFGWTCPGWAFSWGWSPAGIPWILQNCWEYYEYTGDLDFMRERIYPMLREEARLYDQILVDSGDAITLEDQTASTRLVSAPTYSPEHGPYTLGNAYEQELLWQLYEDSITAAELLGVDEELVKVWKENQSRLAPIEIGDSGQIKEWYHETTLGSVGQRGHRHMSHLLGLFPGDLISVENKEYADAAVVSLEDRGMDSTGWGMCQRINAWARLGYGEKSHAQIQKLIKEKIYVNLWDTHPPFQIDGNFGYTSSINEMLMQSNMGYINILPALPQAWSDGFVDGIVARGNFEVGIEWKDSNAVSVDILSRNGGECTVQYPSIRSAVVKDSNGNEIDTQVISKNRISFDTEEGQTYTITGFEEQVKEVEYIDLSKTVPKKDWMATAGSEEGAGNDGPASWAIDGDTSTWWHSNYNGVNEPVIGENGTNNEFTIDFGREVEINMLEYVPRSVIAGNGFITGYQIYSSKTADGDDFKLLSSGSWANDTSTKSAEFESTRMRRIQIRATATAGGSGDNRFISAVEFNVYKVIRNVIEEPDHTLLKDEAAYAEKMDLSGYTQESAAAFRKALEKANRVLGYTDASQNEIDKALEALRSAKDSLEKKPDPAIDDEKPQDNEKPQNTPTPPVSKPEIPAEGRTFEAGGLQYKVTVSAAANGQVTVTKLLNKNKKKVVIPATVALEGYTFRVTAVAAKAFRKNSRITSVTFGTNITGIGTKSFLKCRKLQNIIFKSKKAPRIGKQAFKGIKTKCRVRVPKKMAAKQLKNLKKRMKTAGVGSKAVYKKK